MVCRRVVAGVERESERDIRLINSFEYNITICIVLNIDKSNRTKYFTGIVFDDPGKIKSDYLQGLCNWILPPGKLPAAW